MRPALSRPAELSRGCGPNITRGHSTSPAVRSLNPVTIDTRTLRTTYNVLDNHSGARKWLRGGFEWDITNDVKLKSQAYPVHALNATGSTTRSMLQRQLHSERRSIGQVYRERLSVDHNQRLNRQRHRPHLNSSFAGDGESRRRRRLRRAAFSSTSCKTTAFTSDAVIWSTPSAASTAPQQTKTLLYARQQYLAVIRGPAEDHADICRDRRACESRRSSCRERHSTSMACCAAADGYPFTKTFRPTTGRIGYTWEALPGLTFYSQYATAADPAVANIFILRPTQPLLLTTSRIYETGVKQLFWDKRAEWTFSAFDIERNNVYSAKGGQQVKIAGKVGVEGHRAGRRR